MTPDRRALMRASLALPALGLAASGCAQTTPALASRAPATLGLPTPRPPALVPLAELMEGENALPLWPGDPPGGSTATRAFKVDPHGDPLHPDRWLTGLDKPMLLASRPARPNGAAVLLVPGGGYGFLAFDNEGFSQQAWLNALGVTTFILLYRLPGEGWSTGPLAPLQDAQRAMRVIRREAARFSLDPERLAVMGFSAGGHLAGMLATRAGEATYEPIDAADRLLARPALAALVYPVITLLSPYTHKGSRDFLLGAHADDVALQRRWSVETRVDTETPPSFICAATDDGLVPVDNSLAYYAAMRAAQRPAELHLFAQGGHAFGVRLPPGAPVMQWPTLFASFARSRRLFT